jgi:DNA-binding NarL/FixJ family response regulator
MIADIADIADIAVVAEAEDGASAVERYAAQRPEVVVMDLRMPRLDGVSAIRAIYDADPSARIVALTTYEGGADIYRALSAGACAYLVKDVLVGELVNAIRSAAAGKRVIPAAVARTLAEFTPARRSHGPRGRGAAARRQGTPQQGHQPNVNANASTPGLRNSISNCRSVIGFGCRIS